MINNPSILILFLAAGCASVPVRPCSHGGGVSLTAHAEDGPAPLPAGPGGRLAPPPGSAVGIPVVVRVTVHNGRDEAVAVRLRCGDAGGSGPVAVVLEGAQERDLWFSVLRRQGLSTSFYCEVEDVAARGFP